jgi:hypothetical protein
MQETLELFEPVPTLKTTKERLLGSLIAFGLSYGYIIIALLVWWETSWYIALSILLLAYIVTGIISSKILHLYVPYKQHEFSYSSKDLAAWVIEYYRVKTPSS